MLAASTTAIGWVIFTIITLGWVVYFFANRRSARAELGSEVELAPNRKPYYDDETLEGPRLERVQLFGVLLLAVLVIALPLYRVFEPARQSGATEGKEGRFVSWGGALYATTAEGGFNCAGCHGANGGGGQPWPSCSVFCSRVRAVFMTSTLFWYERDAEIMLTISSTALTLL